MRSFLIAALLAAPAAALAQPSKPADVSKMATDDCKKAHAAGKTCVLTIDDGDDVKGNRPTAGDPPLVGRGDATMTSLIKIRRDFITEILKTAEDID